MPIYAAGMLSALLSQWLSLAVYAAVAVFYVVESAIFGRNESQNFSTT